MAFIDKLKKQSNIVSDSIKGSVSGAATAVGLVDANKQKLKSLEAEKAKMYEFIGMEVFVLYRTGEVSIDVIAPFCEKLQAIKAEIDHVETEITKSVRNCECGAKLQKGAKFCSGCGKNVEIEQPLPQAEAKPVIECVCGSEIKNETLMCMECGRKIDVKQGDGSFASS